MHIAVEPLRQPLLQPVFGRGQIHPCHTNLGKSQFTGPLLNLRNELTAAPHTGQIVESTLLAARLVWRSEDDTAAFARQLAAQSALRNAFITLHGDLGAGKTTLVRHLLRSLGITGRIKSPTYAVVEPHEAPGLHIWHFDFYRFSDPREWEDAGFRDIFTSAGLKIAEWPEKAFGHVPTADLAIEIEANTNDERHVTLRANTPAGRSLLERMSA